MKILLVNVPSRLGPGGRTIPLGLLYVANVFSDSGCDIKIFDMYYDGDVESLLDVVGEYRPDIVGYGGIATSYPKVKIVSQAIKRRSKDIIHIAGGPLASTYDLLLGNRIVDYVVHGEAEVSLPKLIYFIQGRYNLERVGGISYLKGEEIQRNNPEKQIEDLDSTKLPPYHLVDMQRYVESLKDWQKTNEKEILANRDLADRVNHIISTGRDTYLTIISSRGCTHRCSFCYRHVRGIRRHGIDYVAQHARYLIDTYNLGGIYFVDELFNSNKQWVLELCDAIEGLDILFYRVGGSRVDMMNEDMLKRLSDTGCIDIGYGQESGSAKILKEYRKGVTVKQNTEVTALTKAHGMLSIVQLVIGSPSETTRTILETVQFLKRVDAYDISLNYLIPLPETPIWQYVKENRLVQNVEQYLGLVAEYGGAPLTNLTKESDRVWKSWGWLITTEVKLHYYRRTARKTYYLYKILFYLTHIILPLIPWVRTLIPKQVIALLLR